MHCTGTGIFIVKISHEKFEYFFFGSFVFENDFLFLDPANELCTHSAGIRSEAKKLLVSRNDLFVCFIFENRFLRDGKNRTNGRRKNKDGADAEDRQNRKKC